jgi:predicted permease
MGDLSYAVRSLRKSPLASITIIVTVALGLGMVASVFTFLNVFMFRVDNVPHVHEFYGAERPRTAEGDLVRLTRPVYDALRHETAVFTDVFAMVPETDSRVNGRTMSGTLVTGNFFQVLGVGAARGRVLTPADDEGREPVVVLSDRGWSTHFANDPAVLDRSLLINGIRYGIVGVMPKGFRGLMVGAPDYWAPLSLMNQLQPALAAAQKDIEVDIIGRLRPDLSRQAAQAQLIAWDARRNERAAERQSAGITLVPRRGTVPQPMESVLVFTPLFVSFGLILLIGCANVASLLLARAVSRQKEVGVRLSLGASRARIVRQLLTESVILALIAAALGYAISRLILETTIWAVMSTMPPDIGDVRLLVPEGDWRVGVFLMAAAIVASAMFGLVPALQATRIELVRTMRGEVMPDARPGRTRNVLIGLQVTASALLLISAGIFLRSAFASASADPGIRTSDTAIVPVVNEKLRRQIVDAVSRDPVVVAVAAALPDPVFGSRPALTETSQAKSPAAYKFVSPEYFDVLGIEMVRGRTFTAAESSVSANAGVAIVAESFARQMWPSGDALGQTLRLDRDPAVPPSEKAPPALTGSFTVVGIARDVRGFAFAEGSTSPTTVYVPITSGHADTTLAVRVAGDPERARSVLLERLTAVDPNIEQIVTLKTIAGMATYFLKIGFWLTVVLGALALTLTLSGVFSVMSYLVEQRTKEIGVRIALGATARDVAGLVIGQTAKPVGVGLMVGAALALATGILLLSSVEAIGSIVRLLDPIAYLASLLIIIVACAIAACVPTLHAARIDPMKSLRHE